MMQSPAGSRILNAAAEDHTGTGGIVFKARHIDDWTDLDDRYGIVG